MSGQPPLPAIPLALPLLPLRDVVVFPHMVIPLFVGRPKSIKALEAAMSADRSIMLVAQKAAAKDEPGLWQPSLRIEPSEIRGAAGAGDAFAAGFLLGRHEGWDVAQSLCAGVATAATSLLARNNRAGPRSSTARTRWLGSCANLSMHSTTSRASRYPRANVAAVHTDEIPTLADSAEVSVTAIMAAFTRAIMVNVPACSGASTKSMTPSAPRVASTSTSN